MKKLKILLVEDTEVHRQAAVEQLKDHELIICKTFKEFQAQQRNFSSDGKFDVILTDCLMPAEASAYVPQEGHSKDQVPFGTIIILWAIQNNIPKAGMLMLNNHHDHPIAAGLDIIGGSRKDVRKYGNTEVLIATGDYYKDDPNGEAYSSKLRSTNGNYIKEWGLFLQKLMGEATW